MKSLNSVLLKVRETSRRKADDWDLPFHGQHQESRAEGQDGHEQGEENAVADVSSTQAQQNQLLTSFSEDHHLWCDQLGLRPSFDSFLDGMALTAT